MRMIALVLVLLASMPAWARQQPDITLERYQARTIVTGTDMRSRPAGLAACLGDVLVKVSGDPTVADDPLLPELASRAAEFVADFSYRDRMSGLPLGDEQGSYDRPFYLTVRFTPTRIDAALRALGREPWAGPRPHLMLLFHVRPTTGDFDLTATEPRADDMRASLAEAGQRYGMEVEIPPPPLPPADAIEPSPDRVAVTGSLVLSEAALGWVGAWRMTWQGREYAWGPAGVNFDEAFRQAVRGAMQIVSGHGTPH